MEIQIIRADETHLEALSVLFNGYRQFYRQEADIEAAKAFVGERIRLNESVIFMAYHGDEALGFVQLYPIFSSVRMGRAWLLNDLFVSPNARKSGVGALLMNAAAEHGRATNAKFLLLQTEVTNHNAQRLYEKSGWLRDNECYYYFLKP